MDKYLKLAMDRCGCDYCEVEGRACTGAKEDAVFGRQCAREAYEDARDHFMLKANSPDKMGGWCCVQSADSAEKSQAEADANYCDEKAAALRPQGERA